MGIADVMTLISLTTCFRWSETWRGWGKFQQFHKLLVSFCLKIVFIIYVSACHILAFAWCCMLVHIWLQFPKSVCFIFRRIVEFTDQLSSQLWKRFNVRDRLTAESQYTHTKVCELKNKTTSNLCSHRQFRRTMLGGGCLRGIFQGKNLLRGNWGVDQSRLIDLCFPLSFVQVSSDGVFCVMTFCEIHRKYNKCCLQYSMLHIKENSLSIGSLEVGPGNGGHACMWKLKSGIDHQDEDRFCWRLLW